MKARKNLFLLVTLVTVSLGTSAQEKYNLSYRFEKGREYRYRNDMTIESTQEMMGNEVKMNIAGMLNTRYAVESVAPDGTIHALYTVSESEIRMKGMGNDTTVKIMPKDGHDTLRAVISPTGRIISQQAIDTTPGKGPSMMAGLSERIRLFELPDHPVAIGDKWEIASTDTVSQTGLIINVTHTQCTLTGKEDIGGRSCLKIEYKGTGEVTGKMLQMGMEMFMEGSTETTGTAWYDATSGLLVKDDSSADSDMTMALTGQAQMTIPITQKIHTVTTLVE